MTAFDPRDPDQGRINEAVAAILRTFGTFIVWGDGAPAHTPDGPQLYFEQDGPGVHIYNGSWTAL